MGMKPADRHLAALKHEVRRDLILVAIVVIALALWAGCLFMVTVVNAWIQPWL